MKTEKRGIKLSVQWKMVMTGLVVVGAFIAVIMAYILPGIQNSIIDEKETKIKESLMKSKEMAKGNYWKILGRLVVFGLFMIIVEMALSVIPFGVGTVLASLCGALFILPTYLLYKEVSAS